MRAARWLLVGLLAACGGGGKDSGKGGPGKGGGSTCEPDGTLAGCFSYETTDCTNSALDGLPGGWFDDRNGQLVIGLATTREGADLTITVPETGNLIDGTEFDIPTQARVELWAGPGKEQELYYACTGLLRVTNYSPGELLWATITFQARGPMGVCGESDWYMYGAELVNAVYCGG